MCITFSFVSLSCLLWEEHPGGITETQVFADSQAHGAWLLRPTDCLILNQTRNAPSIFLKRTTNALCWRELPDVLLCDVMWLYTGPYIYIYIYTHTYTRACVGGRPLIDDDAFEHVGRIYIPVSHHVSVLSSVPTTLSIVHHFITYLAKANQWLGYFFGCWSFSFCYHYWTSHTPTYIYIHVYVYIYIDIYT